MIRFNRCIEDFRDFQAGDLPENAVRIETPRTIDDTMKHAAPACAVLCLIVSLTAFGKVFFAGAAIKPAAVFIGLAVGLVLLIVHELLHAAVYPKAAAVTVGKLKGKLTFVALASYPMIRGRFLLMCLLPFVLGIVPLAVFVLSPAEAKWLNGMMFGMACIGMISPSPDVDQAVTVLRHANRNDRIMFYRDDLYKIEKNPD